MGTTRATWHRATRLHLTWSFASALLVNFGCSGGMINDHATGGGGNVGLGGAGSGGGTAVSCYSPTQNLNSAYQTGAQGCSCNPATDADVCVQGVALICVETQWTAVEDGPCMPMPGTGGVGNIGTGGTNTGGIGTGGTSAVACYSPTQNLASAYQTGATGCACNPTTDASVCVQGVGLICTGSRWMAVIDGPCMPTPGNGGTSSVSMGGSATAGGPTAGNGNVGNAGGALGGTTAPTCFSPTQNLSGISPGAPGGCPCSSGGSVCVNGLGLMCYDGHWNAVWDGPCGTGGRTSIGGGGSSSISTGGGSTVAEFSPEGCKAAGGNPVPKPVGVTPAPEGTCPSGTALGIITYSSSGWAEGGWCCVASKACGARAGNTCSASEYCAYEEGELCGRGDMEAVCKPRPQACDALYAPVCGCDNKTYSSACVAAVAGVGVYTNSTCTH